MAIHCDVGQVQMTFLMCVCVNIAHMIVTECIWAACIRAMQQCTACISAYDDERTMLKRVLHRFGTSSDWKAYTPIVALSFDAGNFHSAAHKYRPHDCYIFCMRMTCDRMNNAFIGRGIVLSVHNFESSTRSDSVPWWRHRSRDSSNNNYLETMKWAFLTFFSIPHETMKWAFSFSRQSRERRYFLCEFLLNGIINHVTRLAICLILCPTQNEKLKWWRGKRWQQKTKMAQYFSAPRKSSL